MTKKIQFLEHIADVRMQVEDETLPGLFVEALLGMFAYLHPETGVKEVKRRVVIRSPDRAALLVDFLNEALSLAQSYKESYEAVEFDTLAEEELAGWLYGHGATSFGEDIKAVTYHEASVERIPETGWRARIILDI